MNLEGALLFLFSNTPFWVLPDPSITEFRSYRSCNGFSHETESAFKAIEPDQVIDLAAIYGYDCGKNPYFAPSETLN